MHWFWLLPLVSPRSSLLRRSYPLRSFAESSLPWWRKEIGDERSCKTLVPHSIACSGGEKGVA